MMFAATMLLIWAATTSPLAAETLLCAGTVPPEIGDGTAKAAAAPVRPRIGTRNALVVFARFADSGGATQPPTWSASFFDPGTPGTFSHFYDTMSRQRLRVRGEVAPGYYVVSQPASAYVGDRTDRPGHYGDVVAEILPQVDADVDFRRYDNDGPDGVADSGDDDGVVDALFVILPETPANFLQGPATGIANLGLRDTYATNDVGATGVIQISSVQGTVQRGRTFNEAVGTVCHEFGHLLGLPDLFDAAFLGAPEPLPPSHDSAGIGRWGLMGWGALGWHGDDGPASLSAWSRDVLGWTRAREPRQAQEQIALTDTGLEGDVFVIPLSAHERFLLEYRTRRSSYYDRNIPAEGLLIWHDGGSSALLNYDVDLETADGRWQDSGSPLGRIAAPEDGEDNLDFWAHDADYAAAHAGNLGDAGDPFDGIRFREFTRNSNPTSHSTDGTRSIRIEDIHVTPDSVRALVTTAPAQLKFTFWRLEDSTQDGALSSGQEAGLTLRIRNEGGVALQNVRARVRSLDPLVTVADSIVDFGTVAVGRSSGIPLSPFPRLLVDEFEGERQFPLDIRISSAQTSALDTTIVLTAVATFMVHGRTLDEELNPVSDTRIQFISGARHYAVISDEEGFYTGDVIPGEYTLFVTPPPPYLSEFHQVSVFEDTDLDLIQQAGLAVSGTVVDTAGQPIANAFVNVNRQYATTGTNGRFRMFAAPGPGVITIQPPPEAMLPILVRQVTISGPEDWRFVIAPGLTVRLNLVGEWYQGVYLTGSAGLSFSQLDEDGGATHIVRAGIYQLFPFSATSATTGHGAIFRVESDTLLSFVAPQRDVVTGHLIDRSTIPGLSPLLVFRAESAPVQAQTEVFADGAFGETRLQHGRYSVRLHGETGSAPGQILDTIDVHGAMDVDFAPRDGTPFQGKLLDGVGRAVANADILLSSRTSAAWTYAPSDGDGAFQIYAFPGQYRGSIRLDSTMYQLAPAAFPGPVTLALPGGTVAGRLALRPADDAQPALVGLVDDPLSLFAVAYIPLAEGYMLRSVAPASASLVGNDGTFAVAGQGRYLVALPARGRGAGTVVDLVEDGGTGEAQRIAWPTARRDTLYGVVSSLEDANVSGAVLRLYDPGTSVVAQTLITRDSGGYVLDLPSGTYRGRLGLLDPDLGFLQQYDLGTVVVDGNRRWDIELTDVATVVSTSAAASLPAGPELAQNYPNPFNANTVIRFRLPGDGDVRLEVFDILGRHVATVVDERRLAGVHTVAWDGHDDKGHQVGSGVYLYRLHFRSQRLTRKLLLLR